MLSSPDSRSVAFITSISATQLCCIRMEYSRRVDKRSDGTDPQSLVDRIRHAVRSFSLQHWRTVGVMLELVSRTKPYRTMLLYLTLVSFALFLFCGRANKATSPANLYNQSGNRNALSFGPPIPMNMPELQSLCQTTKWQPGLYFVCDDR